MSEQEFDEISNLETEAWIAFDNDQYDRAIELASKAIELAPHSARSYYIRANAAESLRRYEDALKDIDAAIKLEQNARYYLVKATVSESLNRLDEAIVSMTNAISISDDEFYIISRAIYYKKHNLIDLALLDLGRIKKTSPYNALAETVAGSITKPIE